jgi:hypothetical protein
MNVKVELRIKEVTEKAKRLLIFITKQELLELLKITRVTLNNRLQQHTWTVEEECIIDLKLKEYIKIVNS